MVKQRERLRACSFSSDSIDSYGNMDPEMVPFWHLGRLASSVIMLNESSERTLYGMAQVAKVQQLVGSTKPNLLISISDRGRVWRSCMFLCVVTSEVWRGAAEVRIRGSPPWHGVSGNASSSTPLKTRGFQRYYYITLLVCFLFAWFPASWRLLFIIIINTRLVLAGDHSLEASHQLVSRKGHTSFGKWTATQMSLQLKFFRMEPP